MVSNLAATLRIYCYRVQVLGVKIFPRFSFMYAKFIVMSIFRHP